MPEYALGGRALAMYRAYNPYESNDRETVKYMYNRAVDRDSHLTFEENRAKVDALRICELGDKYWLRAHP